MTDSSSVETRSIGVIAEWQAVDNAWIDHRWRVTAVLDGAPDLPAWTCIENTPGMRRFYAGPAELSLFPRETDTLKHNLESSAPAVYVFLRATGQPPGMELIGATVCVGEAHAHADTGSDLVEAVPMPAAIAAWTADYVARHHVEEEPFRRRREGVGGRDRGRRT
jgi:hypothetical protein